MLTRSLIWTGFLFICCMAKRRLRSKVVIQRVKVYHKNLSKDKVVGYAYSGFDPYIEIDPNQTDKEYFLTCTHELLHLLLPDLGEREIIRIEKTFGQCLWKSVRRLKKKWKDKIKKKKK